MILLNSIVEVSASAMTLRPLEPIVLIRVFASTVIAFMLTKHILPSMTPEYMISDAWIESYINILLNGIVT